jgi:hypothetical protein
MAAGRGAGYASGLARSSSILAAFRTMGARLRRASRQAA